MLRNDQVPLFIQVQLWKMVKFTHIIILKFKISEKSLLISAEAVGTVVLDYLKGDN